MCIQFWNINIWDTIIIVSSSRVLFLNMTVLCFQGSTSSWSGATANGNKKSTEEGEMVSCTNLFISLRSQCPGINCSTLDWIKSWWNLKESASGFYSCPKPYNQSFHSILCILWNWNAREMENVWNILIVDGYDGEWGGGGWDRLKKS